MANDTYVFYECENGGCRLRFPGQKGIPAWKRCPRCRSTIKIVDIVETGSVHGNTAEEMPCLSLAVVLDNIRSAWNVGSIFRTSDGFGINKIYCCGITPTPENPKVAKTALGAENDIQWEQTNNGLVKALDLKSQGCFLMALENLPTSRTLNTFQLPVNQGMVLVVGNEEAGIDPAILKISDSVVSIPMMGKKRSHNVAVAFAIAASFLFYRQIESQESRRIFPST